MKKIEEGFKLVKDDKSNPVYADGYGNEYGAYSEDLFDYLDAQVLAALSNLFNMTEETAEMQGMGTIFRIVVSDASRKLDALRKLAKERLGGIDVHALNKGYPWYDDNLPVGFFLDMREREEDVDCPSLSTLIECLDKGLLNAAIGAAKELIAEIEKKQAGKEEETAKA
ncbi:MAG: hypothetical protein CVU57_20410 [Deltaproteobacteria bacterium HGW-Deltaproteobacteria-15]|jgi:hypothetical protein|nr:MAG: hypothetical protein CVU57_20410 [Deltaproteobacteria bacterium HGW-Deltaproteobacteria-15]